MIEFKKVSNGFKIKIENMFLANILLILKMGDK